MTISVDTEAFNKIQHPVLIKILNEPGIERKSLNLIKRDLYKKKKNNPELISHLMVKKTQKKQKKTNLIFSPLNQSQGCLLPPFFLTEI